jgi:hypothetical protein
MARINIDDDVESRPEFRRLLKLVAYDDDKALGILVRFWRLAQKYWGEHQLVPMEEIENWEFQPIIDSRWGIVKPEGVYAIGSEERFAWYRQKCDAAKKGGRPKEPKLTGDKPEEIGTQPEHQSDSPRIDSANPLAPAPVPVLVPVPEKKEEIQKQYFAPSSSNSEARTKVSIKELDPEGPTATALTWRSYRDAYQEKYGEPPPYNGKIAGQLKSFVSRVPKEEAPQIAAFYLTHKDQYYVKSMHPVGLLLRDAEKIRTEWATGRQMTGAQARQSEQRNTNVEAMKTYLASKGAAQ